MARARRGITPFNLSFLDVMFCGFGAVVLLVMLINGKTISQREESQADLRGQLRALQHTVDAAAQTVRERRAALERTAAELARTRAQAEEIRRAMAGLTAASAGRQDPAANTARIEALKADLRRLSARIKVLRAQAAQNAGGEKVRAFTGDGDRQYLTGLKVGGDRILILLDMSASMLDRTIVNVIRLRNMDEATRRTAAKWRQALRTTRWLLANLPRDSRFQLFVFNTTARPLLEGSAGRWLAADDAKVMEQIDRALDVLTPADGTSLYQAFSVASTLSPPPDNILLLTDGLPTQGKTLPRRATVSGERRLKHFRQAITRLGEAIPVNTILFPMEGDPVAAAAFWHLATLTRGSFLTPSPDWP
jgi:hypothetical protein